MSESLLRRHGAKLASLPNRNHKPRRIRHSAPVTITHTAPTAKAIPKTGRLVNRPLTYLQWVAEEEIYWSKRVPLKPLKIKRKKELISK